MFFRVSSPVLALILFAVILMVRVGDPDRQLLVPPNATWRRAAEDLHRETRRAKEELSSSPRATATA